MGFLIKNWGSLKNGSVIFVWGYKFANKIELDLAKNLYNSKIVENNCMDGYNFFILDGVP